MEHMLTITKKKGTKIGISLSPAGSSFLITKILESGMIPDWNMEHPEQEVRKYDRVMDVNGVRARGGNLHALVRICEESDSIVMLVHRTAGIEHRILEMECAEVSQNDIDMLSLLDAIAPTQTGMGRSFVAEFPKANARSCGIDQCYICFNDCEEDTTLTQLPCKHHFCTVCIMKWLTQTKTQCPMCNTDVLHYDDDCFDDSLCVASERDNASPLVNTRHLSTKIKSVKRGMSFGQHEEI